MQFAHSVRALGSVLAQAPLSAAALGQLSLISCRTLAKALLYPLLACLEFQCVGGDIVILDKWIES